MNVFWVFFGFLWVGVTCRVWTVSVWTESLTFTISAWKKSQIDVGCFFCFFSSLFVPSTHHIPLLSNSNVNPPSFPEIKDPLFQAFLKRKHPFAALKCYAELTEDNELLSKVEIVNLYKSDIPHLVARLKKCAESHRSNAGLCEIWE